MSTYVEEETWIQFITWRARKERAAARLEEIRRLLHDDTGQIPFADMPELLAQLADEAFETE